MDEYIRGFNENVATGIMICSTGIFNGSTGIIEDDGSLAGTYPDTDDLLTFAEVTCTPPDIGYGITKGSRKN